MRDGANLPLIRWAGSKRQLVPIILREVPSSFDRYIEPFAGSACLFFAINPKKAIIADLNGDLISSYKTITKHPVRVLRLARSLDNSPDSYYHIRSQAASPSPLITAARFLYLNRYCFNALYRTNKMGRFNVPIGNRTGGFPDEDDFRRSAAALGRAQLLCADFETTLKLTKKGDFVYLDPPYVTRPGADKNVYGFGTFDESDLPRLVHSLRAIHKKGVRFLLSYSHSPQLLDLILRKSNATIEVRRHISGKIGGRGYVKELLLNNEDVFGTV